MAQNGFIFKKGGSWFLRYRANVIEDGRVVRKQCCKKLAPVNDTYRTEKDLHSLRDEILRPINDGKVEPESWLSVAEYAESYWLPWVRENCKPSTIAGYQRFWESYLAPRLQSTTLRDFRTVDAANLLADLGLGRTMLKHCKSILSGIFTLAKNQGVLDTPNPVQGTMIPKKAKAPRKTHKATPEEVLSILNALENAKPERGVIDRTRRLQARAAIALQFFAGLRPGEARGVCWEDYDGKRLTVRQSVWHTHITTTKTDHEGDEPKQVPVIEPLADILGQLREADGNPASGPILRGPRSGKPLNLDNLAKRVLAPLLKAAKIERHDLYSLRRGIATTLTGLSKDPVAAKGLLRHSSVATTMKHYIGDVPENTLAAIDRLEKLFNDCSTVKQ